MAVTANVVAASEPRIPARYFIFRLLLSHEDIHVDPREVTIRWDQGLPASEMKRAWCGKSRLTGAPGKSLFVRGLCPPLLASSLDEFRRDIPRGAPGLKQRGPAREAVDNPGTAEHKAGKTTMRAYCKRVWVPRLRGRCDGRSYSETGSEAVSACGPHVVTLGTQGKTCGRICVNLAQIRSASVTMTRRALPCLSMSAARARCHISLSIRTRPALIPWTASQGTSRGLPSIMRTMPCCVKSVGRNQPTFPFSTGAHHHKTYRRR